MSDDLVVCKRCSHLKGNHVSSKCIKCDCQQFVE